MKIQIAVVYNKVGKSYDNFGNSAKALEYYILSLKASEKLTTGNGMMVCAINYMDIAGKYNGRDDRENALFYRRKALDLIHLIKSDPKLIKEAEEFDDQDFDSSDWSLIEGGIYDGMGTTYLSSNNLDSSLYYYEKAAEIFKSADIKEAQMISMQNIGNIYMIKKDYNKALGNFQAVLDFGLKNNDVVTVAQPSINMAQIYSAQELYTKSISVLSQARQKILESNITYSIEMYYYYLTEAWRKLGKFEKALVYQDSLIHFKDSVSDSQNQAQIAGMKVQFETSEKDKLIQLLKKENKLKALETEKTILIRNILLLSIIFILILGSLSILYFFNRQKTNVLTREKETLSAKMEGQDAERQRIATDLHDRLGSILATVKLYFNAVDSNIEQLKMDTKGYYIKANALLDDACEEVRKISHDLASDLLNSQGLIPALHNLRDTLTNSLQLSMHLSIHGLKERLSPVTEVTIYRIIQELTSNVIKHSQAKNVTVQLTRQDNNLNIVVEDDGIGFDTENPEFQMGLGLKSVSERVLKLNGKAYFDSHEKKGTTVVIDIPV